MEYRPVEYRASEIQGMQPGLESGMVPEAELETCRLNGR